MENKSQILKVKCPQCGKSIVYSTSNAYRPFCSERCRLIDLGQWADESYRIPTPTGETERDYANEDENLC